MASSSSKIVKEGVQNFLVPNPSEETAKEAKRWYEDEGSPKAKQCLRSLAILLSTEAGQQEACEIIEEIVQFAITGRGSFQDTFGQADLKHIIYGAVFFVASGGSVEALKKLTLVEDLDWNTVNKRGCTALHCTMRDRDFGRGLEKAKLLQGITDLNALDDYGRSVLHCAAWTSDKNALEFCLQLGLDINGKDFAGRTPLHCAMMSFNGERIIRANVKCLIERGADPDIKDEEGETPLDALMGGRAELRESMKRFIELCKNKA